MCARYELSAVESIEISEIIRQQKRKSNLRFADPIRNDMFPKLAAPIITAGKTVEVARWGFPNFKNNGVVFNSKAETVLEKPMFKESLRRSRCIISTTGFYEWSKISKQMYKFRLPEDNALYLGGFYNDFRERRYSILTTEANNSVKEIHHRMPVVLTRDALDVWLTDTDVAEIYISLLMPQLSFSKC